MTRKLTRRIVAIFCFSALAMVSFGDTQAQTTRVVNISDFSGSETVIDFNALSPGETITNQFDGDGLEITGTWQGATEDFVAQTGNTSNRVAHIEVNSTPQSFSVLFDTPFQRVGYLMGTQSPDVGSIPQLVYHVFPRRNGINLSAGNVFQHHTTGVFDPGFIGWEDPDGIDELLFSISSTGNHYLDDIRFENLESIPEPSTLGLVALGLAGVAVGVRRRRRR